MSHRPARRVVAAVVLTAGLGLAACGGGGGGGASSIEDALPKASSPEAQRGRSLVIDEGCATCHVEVDGADLVGPSWMGLAGSKVKLTDGTTVVADTAYLTKSITDPKVAVVDGYPPIMPSFTRLGPDEVTAIVAYLETLGDA